jgi:hypothetical protein
MSEAGTTRTFGTVITRAISVWGLLVLRFSSSSCALKPDTFLTPTSAHPLQQSVQALVALSVFIR